jgi:hypothetical protein
MNRRGGILALVNSVVALVTGCTHLRLSKAEL